MKNLAIVALCALSASAAVLAFPGPSQEFRPFPETQDEDATLVRRAAVAWDYEVVGLTDLHAGALDTAREILEGAKNASDLLEFGKKADDALVEKTEKVLDEMGAQGWELVVYRQNVLVFKRPRS